MPELKRVVTAFGEKLEMRQTLDDALRAIFSAESVPALQTEQAISGIQPQRTLPQMAAKALEHYNKAKDYLKKGDWAGYRRELNQLQQILQNMAGKK